MSTSNEDNRASLSLIADPRPARCCSRAVANDREKEALWVIVA